MIGQVSWIMNNIGIVDKGKHYNIETEIPQTDINEIGICFDSNVSLYLHFTPPGLVCESRSETNPSHIWDS